MSYIFQRVSRPIFEKEYPGCRNFVSRAFSIRGIPEAYLDICLSSLIESSFKQYNTCLKKWWDFCSTYDENPFSSTVNVVMKFLTEIFLIGAAQSSLNCYRSAISLVIGPHIAQDPNMMRFFKGVANLRPAQPKYSSTWDLKIVLDYYSAQPDNKDLSDADLTFKAVILTALITAHRMQTLSLIKLEKIEARNNTLEIKVPDRIKTTKANRHQPLLILPYNSKNSKLCVASTIDSYIERTRI